MHVPIKTLIASPLAHFKGKTNLDRPNLSMLFRCSLVICVIAALQALYFQLTVPTEDTLEVTTMQTELVRSQTPHLFNLGLLANNEVKNIRGACSGYSRSESNIQGGEQVRVWQSYGEIYQIQTLDGRPYQASADATPCTLATTLNSAAARPQMPSLIALLGALVALTCTFIAKLPRVYAPRV
jgi:hypothetical protein